MTDIQDTLTQATAPGAAGTLGGALSQERIFVAFAGGGAKGLVHVAALKALESRGAAFQGFAGTSAGAIVAALAAVGITADEMIDPHSNTSIVTELGRLNPRIKRLTDLFGPGGWTAIRAFRTVVKWLTSPRLEVRLLVAGVMIGAVCLAIFGLFAGLLDGLTGSILAMMGWIFVLGVLACLASLLFDGLARLHVFHEALDQLLASRVFGPGSGQTVRFSDFDGVTRPLLKIVASDITHERLRLFSRDVGADTSVADAVAASVCLPLIFAPWRIADARLVDGGVVLNFPAWPFDEERAVDEDAITVGFEFGQVSPDAGETSANRPARPWPVAVVQTALFGSAQLSTRAVGRSEFITLRPNLDLLDFDIAGPDARKVLADVTLAAQATIDTRLIIVPEVYRRACGATKSLVDGVLQASGTSLLADPAKVGRVRCAVAAPFGDFLRSVKVRHGVGNEEDPDRRIILPISDSLAGRSWEDGATRFELFPIGKELTRPQDAALRRQVWRDLAWRLCVPISNPNGKRVVVVLVDGSAVLVNSVGVVNAFTALARTIEADFTAVVTQLMETWSHEDI